MRRHRPLLIIGLGVALIMAGVFALEAWDVFNGLTFLVCGFGIVAVGVSYMLEDP